MRGGDGSWPRDSASGWARRVKLYLSSYRLGARPEVLVELAGEGRRAGIVANACDAYDQPRLILGREHDDLVDLGFDPVEVDLRHFFGAPDRLSERLSDLDLLWVTGGNSFVLARAMSASGFAAAATDLVREGRLVYGGYSAGVCAIGPTLEGIHLMDDPAVVPSGYPSTDPVPLGWVPWIVVPHWRSDHPEAPVADVAVEHLLGAGLPFRALKDGRVIVIDRDFEALI